MATATKQGGIVRGGEETSHANDGVKYVVKTTGQHVELEGDEIVLCENLMKSDKFFTFTDTPLNIIKTLADEYGCKRGTLTEIQGGEFVICKKVVRDDTPITVSGTPPDIISQLQMEKGCNVHWSWDLKKHDKATCKSCEEHKEMEDGGIVPNNDIPVMDEETYLTVNGASRQDIGDSALHKNRGNNSDKTWTKIVDAQAKKDTDLVNRREELRKEYNDKVAKGELRPPTRMEHLISTANGMEENEATQAARRILTKRGISWKLEKGGGLGDCFVVAGDAMIEYFYDRGRKYSGEPYLVHAEVSGQGKSHGLRFAHAFVEDAIFVYDFSNGLELTLPKQRYFALGEIKTDDPKKYQRYDAEETLDKLIEHDNYGCWDLDCKFEDGGVVLKESIPDYMGTIKFEGGGETKESIIPTVTKSYGLPNPQSVDEVVGNVFTLLEQKRSRKWGAYFVEKYLTEIDKVLAKQFLDKYKITNRAELKVYTAKLQHKARTGKGKERQQILKEAREMQTDYSVARLLSAAEHAGDAEYEDGGMIASDSKITYFYEPDMMMPMDATFQDGALYQTSMAMFKNGGTIPVSNKEALIVIEKLKEEEDEADFTFPNSIVDVERYLNGEAKVIAFSKEGDYKIITTSILEEDSFNGMRKGRHLLFKKGFEHLPVPSGYWMDFWESDHKKYFGVTEYKYRQMNEEERATLENKLQLMLWTKEQYWYKFASFYFPVEYRKWEETGGFGKNTARKNAYWKKYIEDYFENNTKKKMAAGGAVADKPTEKEIEERWDKKKDHIMQLASSLRRLRYNLTADIKSDDEKDRLTALAIAVMDKTFERVGNDESAEEGHAGITGLKKKNIKISGNKVSLNYTGKSGVEQEKSFSDELIAKKLEEAIDKTPDSYVFTTSDGFKIKNDRVNRYLSDFSERGDGDVEISAKDLRGFGANQLIKKKLERETPAEEEKDRVKQFREAVKYAAERVGHGAATLKTHYMIPELEKAFIEKGKIIDLADFYKTGGIVKMAHGGYVEVDAVAGMPSRQWARSAGGVILVAYDTGRCLFLKRGMLVPEPGTWGLLSGGINAGETPKEAIMREMKEEVGHQEDVCFKLAYIYNSKTDDFGFYNFIGVVAKEFVPKLNFENEEYKWCDYRDIPTPLHFGVAELLRNVNLRIELLYALEIYMHSNPHGKS